MNARALLLAAGLLLVPPQAFVFAEDPAVLDLNLPGVLETASNQSVQVIVSRERIQQAVAKIGQSASELLPHAGFSLSQSRQTRNLEAMGIPSFGTTDPLVGPFNSFDARISLNQTLFDWSAVERLRAARAGKKLSEEQLLKTREDVLALSASLYFEAKRAAESIRAAEKMLARDLQDQKSIESRSQSGLGSEIEEEDVSTRVLEGRQRLAEARAQAEEKKLDLLALLGLDPVTKVRFPFQEKPLEIYVPTREEAVEQAQNHPGVRVAEANLKELKAEKRAVYADFLPRVSGLMDYGPSGSSPSNQESTYTVGAKLNWSVLEGGKKIFSLKQARSLIRENEAKKEDALRQSQAGSLSAIENIRQAAGLLETTRQAHRTALKKWRIARERYQKGLGTQQERLDALAGEALARDRRSEAFAVYGLSQIQLAHALGQMEALMNSAQEERHV